MALFLFYTGFSFYIPGETARIANVALGVYLFGIVYSPGEGVSVLRSTYGPYFALTHAVSRYHSPTAPRPILYISGHSACH
jgi:hypothetical protein